MSDNPDLVAFLEELEADGNARLVVRWIDESRAVKEGTSGYTVKNVQRLTLTGSVDGSLRSEVFEGIGRDEFCALARAYNIELIMRSDNVGR